MKLFYCKSCQEVHSLRKTRQECSCGRSAAYYCEEGDNAVFQGDCLPLEFNLLQFAYAVTHQRDNSPAPFAACVVENFAEDTLIEKMPTGLEDYYPKKLVIDGKEINSLKTRTSLDKS